MVNQEDDSELPTVTIGSDYEIALNVIKEIPLELVLRVLTELLLNHYTTESWFCYVGKDKVIDEVLKYILSERTLYIDYTRFHFKKSPDSLVSFSDMIPAASYFKTLEHFILSRGITIPVLQINGSYFSLETDEKYAEDLILSAKNYDNLIVDPSERLEQLPTGLFSKVRSMTLTNPNSTLKCFLLQKQFPYLRDASLDFNEEPIDFELLQILSKLDLKSLHLSIKRVPHLLSKQETTQLLKTINSLPEKKVQIEFSNYYQPPEEAILSPTNNDTSHSVDPYVIKFEVKLGIGYPSWDLANLPNYETLSELILVYEKVPIDIQLFNSTSLKTLHLFTAAVSIQPHTSLCFLDFGGVPNLLELQLGGFTFTSHSFNSIADSVRVLEVRGLLYLDYLKLPCSLECLSMNVPFDQSGLPIFTNLDKLDHLTTVNVKTLPPVFVQPFLRSLPLSLVSLSLAFKDDYSSSAITGPIMNLNHLENLSEIKFTGCSLNWYFHLLPSNVRKLQLNTYGLYNRYFILNLETKYFTHLNTNMTPTNFGLLSTRADMDQFYIDFRSLNLSLFSAVRLQIGPGEPVIKLNDVPETLNEFKIDQQQNRSSLYSQYDEGIQRLCDFTIEVPKITDNLEASGLEKYSSSIKEVD